MVMFDEIVCFTMEFQQHRTLLRISIVWWVCSSQIPADSQVDKGLRSAILQGTTFKSGRPVYVLRECAIPRGVYSPLGRGVKDKGEVHCPTEAYDRLL